MAPFEYGCQHHAASGPGLVFEDADGDGYGTAAPLGGCVVAPASRGGDCDDDDPQVHPAATEVCDNGVDDDCDGHAGPCGPTGTVYVDGGGAVTVRHEGAGSFGGDVRAPGDVTGDGYPDLLVKSSEVDWGVTIVHGGPRPPTGAQPDLTFLASWLDVPAAGAGDLDGDEISDVVVGRWVSDLEPSTLVYRGGATLTGAEPFARTFGASYGAGPPRHLVAPRIADFNGDGRADLAVQAPNKVVILFGPLEQRDVRLDAVPDYIEGADGWPRNGDAGDVDGDGQAELPLRPVPNRFCLTGPGEGGAVPATSGYCVDSGGGWEPRSGGDNDGDGYDDVLFLPGDEGGSVRLYAGGPPSTLETGWTPVATLLADQTWPTSMRFGDEARWIGPVTGGETDTFVVPAWVGLLNPDEVRDSAALLFTRPISGTVGPEEATWLVTEKKADLLGFGPNNVEEFTSAAGADLDLDGYADVALGAYYAGWASEPGAVYILYGFGL